MELSDIDFESYRLHIRESKNGVSRYVVLSKLMSKGIKQYIKDEDPVKFLINSFKKGQHYSCTSIRKLLRATLKRSGINKQVTVHSLRHSFAVHFLEQGGNILQLKEQLGHGNLQSTLIYLKVAQPNYKEVQSPLDVLYQIF